MDINLRSSSSIKIPFFNILSIMHCNNMAIPEVIKANIKQYCHRGTAAPFPLSPKRQPSLLHIHVVSNKADIQAVCGVSSKAGPRFC